MALPPLPPPLPPLPPPPLPSSRRQLVLRTPDIDDIESVEMYRPGGHHPIHLGDVLDHRFKVIHKLGNGGFALVWLARDLAQHQYVALKVLRADATCHEANILRQIQAAAVKPVRIASLLKTFTIHGPNGNHQCLVMDVGGPSLQSLSLHCKRPTLQFLKRASRSLTEGLAALHSVGICHGDLTHSNVLFEIKDFHDWTELEIYRCFGTPCTTPLFLLDGSPAPAFAPTHVVSTLDWSRLSADQLSGNVLIVDFGESFFRNDVPNGLGTPASFYAPEMLFGYPPSSAADLWALGCLLFEMHTFRILLPTAFGSVLEALALAIETIGALPEEWMDRWPDENSPLGLTLDQCRGWFDGSIQRTRTFKSQISNLTSDLSKEQQTMFLDLLKSIMNFEPTHRLSAEMAGMHPWFGDD